MERQEAWAPGMAARQRIVRVRREYNQWVANQTLEDYALRFTAKTARRWSPARVANTALGGISFLALEAIGGTVTVGYGTVYGWALWAGSHESTLPLLHLTPPLSQVPASEQINEFVSHGIFGASVEATRRFVRKRI